MALSKSPPTLKTSSFRKRLLEGNAPAGELAPGAVQREATTRSTKTSVYTQVYTGVENSGHLGPHTSKGPQPETALTKRICPPLST